MFNRLRILHLDDNRQDGELVRAALEDGGLEAEVIWVYDRPAYEAALSSGTFDLVLADLALPGYDGRAALAAARQQRPGMPFIFVTGAVGEEQAVETIRLGATDFVLKDRLERLAPAVGRALREAHERAELKRAEAAVHAERERLHVTLSSIGDAVIAVDAEGRVTFINPVAASLLGLAPAEAGGRPVDEVFRIISASDRQRMENPIGRALREGVVVGLSNNTLLQTADGREVPIDDSGAPIRDVQGHLIGAVLVFRDIGERRAAQAALEAQVRQQAAVAELGQRALRGMDVQQLLEMAVTLVAETLDVELCKVLELLPGGESLLLRAGVGWQPGLVGRGTVGTGLDSQAGFTLVSDFPVVVEDLRREARFSGPPLLHDHGVISGMSVVISGAQQPFGVLGAHSTRPRPFSHNDTHFLQNVANVLGGAIERQRVEDALRLSHSQIAAILEGIADGVTVQTADGRLAYANDAAARIIGSPSAEALAATPPAEIMSKFDCFDESGTPLPLQHLPGRRALRGEARPQAMIRFRLRSTGESRWSHVKARPIVDGSGQVRMAVNIFTDVTDLKLAERQQYVLAEVGHLLSTSLDYHERLSNTARLLVPDLADWCVVDILTPEGGLQKVGAAHADPAREHMLHELRQYYPPDLDPKHPILEVIHSGRPQLAAHISDEQLQARARDAHHLALMRGLGIGSHIVVPLVARGRILGAISLVCGDSSRLFGPEDLALAEELARRAALAVDNARLYGESQSLNAVLEARVLERTEELEVALEELRTANKVLQREIRERSEAEAALRGSREQLRQLSAHMESAREEERSRMAREIHDELGGALSGLKMDLSRLHKAAAGPNADSIREKTTQMAELIDDMVATVRRIALDLRPGVLDDLGLVAAIEWQLSEFGKRAGLAVEAHMATGEVTLQPEVATGLFRVFQETLTNIGRHAQATRASVSLEAQVDSVLLRVSDDGRGISAEQLASTRSLGLLGMRERVRLMGGELQIEGAPGRGTQVVVRVPVLPPASESGS